MSSQSSTKPKASTPESTWRVGDHYVDFDFVGPQVYYHTILEGPNEEGAYRVTSFDAPDDDEYHFPNKHGRLSPAQWEACQAAGFPQPIGDFLRALSGDEAPADPSGMASVLTGEARGLVVMSLPKFIAEGHGAPIDFSEASHVGGTIWYPTELDTRYDQECRHCHGVSFNCFMQAQYCPWCGGPLDCEESTMRRIDGSIKAWDWNQDPPRKD